MEGTATLLTALTLDGGTFTATQIVNASLLDLQRGTLNVTNQALTIGTGGLLGNTLDLNDHMTVNVTLGITNQGLVTGDGQIGGPFANAAAGELRAEPGRSLTLTGSGNTNAGAINLYGGLLEFTQNLTNNAGGFISGNGTLIVSNGLTNNGTMNFSGLANVVGDMTNSVGAKIISSGGGPTTFFDDVANQGEIRTSTGSFTVFFGSVSGTGTFTGLGTVNFEGDLKPGNSPAAVNFAGDVVFGPDATLEVEIGGTTAGSEYDQINVAGQLSLAGTLEISLINGFTPSAGQSFDILNWGSLARRVLVNYPAERARPGMEYVPALYRHLEHRLARRLQPRRHRRRRRLRRLAQDAMERPDRVRHMADPLRPTRPAAARRTARMPTVPEPTTLVLLMLRRLAGVSGDAEPHRKSHQLVNA